MTAKRSELKQQLLEQARRRTTPRAASATPSSNGQGGEQRTVPERFTRFDAQPGYQQIAMMRQAADQLGLVDPFFKVHEGTAGATSVINGQTCINFASYNYLGFSGDPRINQAACDAVARYGTSVSASRVVSGERPIHQELEQALATAYNVEDAVVFVSGHATNVSTLGHLLGPKDLVLHDEYIHNSSLVGTQLSGAKRMSFSHNDPAALEALLARHRHQFERVLVVIEGLYSMDGDIPELPRFIELKQRYQAWLMVDEAHSFGVMGDTGLGLREYFDIDPRDVDIWMGTMSKTMAGCGGYIAGSKPLVETLRYLAPGFLYSVGMPAQVAAPSLAALQLMQQEPERVQRLHAISRYFLEQATARGLDTGKSIGAAVVPVIIGSSAAAARLSNALLEQHINVQPILHPAVPEKSARLRFFLSCEHTQAHIDQTLDALTALLP
ncbi:aminotransferase class I/II-fold pyridoxal phosphate-dependent enzyme [Halomonas sp. ATBC28]|mgnify:FL=1|jgi:8-amino-7-oxononanoate synthase|uniref:Pyridoxal phosphate-dependent transferase, major domain n=1 Tax=Vreelandella titanicae BH1 TaxID=1204738 RepID=L9U6J6_9GAMM|nr:MULTISPECIES: aminotransferase class I/II-fold pyridoxal phosphate-dependent enzyme [Halomonas]NAO97567.1 aminotransferase class I/II-fold pyridoxal phosphate-dependent enzyme [Halomonas sp. MG34]UEQ05745.1 aminotransferase class I/II-fold pyridoxal phosphate-dependent enzyme [Halomonas profundus]ELY20484.1 Pyridoxal phosphate-dependent transferase, major domain [Halomonas titanicae BH1]KIN16420.1 8-amino-7-oxononanoate synthase [Halomonas sp. KHS3]NVE92120.1 aminotransferase class I/II-fol|tara:strand:- start:604 stop:1926 length:1323 start_codon:yes stop_codon:yes gene_type:complete